MVRWVCLMLCLGSISVFAEDVRLIDSGRANAGLNAANYSCAQLQSMLQKRQGNSDNDGNGVLVFYSPSDRVSSTQKSAYINPQWETLTRSACPASANSQQAYVCTKDVVYCYVGTYCGNNAGAASAGLFKSIEGCRWQYLDEEVQDKPHQRKLGYWGL